MDAETNDPEALLAEKGLAFTAVGGAAGNSQRLARAYLDSLCLEMRVIDAPATASTQCDFLGAVLETPVMVTALSALDAIRANGMVETAKGAAAAGAAMFVGVGSDDELAAIVDTGVKAVKIIKPYRSVDRIVAKLEHARDCGALAVGMDVCFGFGMKNGYAPAPMAPKSLDEIRQFVASTPLPFVLKGVLSRSDADKALAAGVAAVMVSHQGGTVMDFAAPPIQVLPRVVAATGGRLPVLVDGAIQSGLDVFKAMALGASGVGVGKAVMAGLAAGGADGVRQVIADMNEELRRTMCLTGAATVAAIDKDVVWEMR